MRRIPLKDGRVVYSFGTAATKEKAALIVTTTDLGLCADILEERCDKYYVQYTEKIDGKYVLVNQGYLANDATLSDYLDMLKEILEGNTIGYIAGHRY